ncbi:Subtilisin-like protease [Hordeum vulgare]|nr:Subtilisin-like protease [Hordeum vulgare]
MSRNGIRDGRLGFFSDISLVLIDEVHILNDPRGAALEAVVSRIKMLSRPGNMKSAPLANVRFIAVSATIPNAEDISSIKKVSQTATSLGAAGFVVVVEDSYPGTKFDLVPVNIPGILITDVSKTKDLIDYYNSSTTRDWAGRATTFQATVGIANGLAPTLFNSAP